MKGKPINIVKFWEKCLKEEPEHPLSKALSKIIYDHFKFKDIEVPNERL